MHQSCDVVFYHAKSRRGIIMSVVYNLFRGMLMVPRNTMEMMHRTLKSSMLNRDSGSGI